MAQGSVTARQQRDGSTVYRVRVWIGGERRSLGSYATRAEAAEALRVALADHAEDAGALTLDSWAQRWLDLRETDGLHRSVANDRSRYRTHIAGTRIASMALRRITRGDCVTWLDDLMRRPPTRAITHGRGESRETTLTEREGRISRQTVTHAVHLVQRCLGDAVARGHLAANPAADLELPRVHERADEPWTWLTLDEIARLEALPGPPPGRERRGPGDRWLWPAERSALLVATYAGLRAGELWGLRWRDVRLDGERPELHVCRSRRGPTKSGRSRRVPLLAQACDALRAWRAAAPGVGDALVWPADGGDCHAASHDAGWETIREWLDLGRRVRLHDLRHTCASHLVQGSWTPTPLRLEDVREWLGHGSIQTTERYAHLAPGGLHAALRRGPQVDRGEKGRSRK